LWLFNCAAAVSSLAVARTEVAVCPAGSLPYLIAQVVTFISLMPALSTASVSAEGVFSAGFSIFPLFKTAFAD